VVKIDPANLGDMDSFRLLSSVIVPRPIAWVSTVGEDGVFNLAPFSSYIGISSKPMVVGFCVIWTGESKKKDTLRNIEFAKEFVINVVDEPLAEPMNVTAAPYHSDVDEFKEVGLTPVKADLVKVPMVAESPINLECRLNQVLEFGEAPRRVSFIVGEVLQVHVRDGLYADGMVQMSKLKVLGRLSGDLYCRIIDTFEMKMPREV